MAENLRNLVEDLASSEPDGTPALIQVDDYLERARLAQRLIEEADLYGIQAMSLSSPEEAQRRLPTRDSSAGRAALVLIDAGRARAWGSWLEANREALPEWVRFLVVLMMPSDVPALARAAPAFMSWTKAFEFRHVEDPGAIPADDVEQELARLERETGMSPEAFVEAWRRGEIPDTFRNTTWLNLASAARKERG